MQVCVGDRVKVMANGSFELPLVIDVKADSIIVKRRKKKGTLTIPKTKFHEMDKAFRGAKFECIVTAKI